ncbi:MAG: WbqC family protein [Saprospiraceae bacterium]|nr:WbqC family protein [Saprospiraceae bacterium]
MLQEETILLELHYLPCVHYFTKICQYPKVCLEQHENYLKRSYRNRCHLAAANGILRLSIPLEKGKNQQMPIRSVKIAYDEPWQKQHLKSIHTAYGNAPFFNDYMDELAYFYHQHYDYFI